MKRFKGLLPIMAILLPLSCSQEKRIDLFNGENLDNWFIFVSDDSIEPGEYFRAEDGVIRTGGVPHGYIRTREAYGNFKLHLEWRWPGEPTNSGVLLHVQGEEMTWPLSIECQLMNGNAGDIVLIGEGSGITVRDSAYSIPPGGSRYKVIPKYGDSSEKPAGQWNTYDITSLDGRLEVTVNGVLQNEGSNMTLTRGHILLQGEGSPIEFRNIWLEPL